MHVESWSLVRILSGLLLLLRDMRAVCCRLSCMWTTIGTGLSRRQRSIVTSSRSTRARLMQIVRLLLIPLRLLRAASTSTVHMSWGMASRSKRAISVIGIGWWWWWWSRRRQWRCWTSRRWRLSICLLLLLNTLPSIRVVVLHRVAATQLPKIEPSVEMEAYRNLFRDWKRSGGKLWDAATYQSQDDGSDNV